MPKISLMKNIVLFALILLLSSCVTNKKLNYLQSNEEINDTISYLKTTPTPYKLRVGDELYIEIKPLYSISESAFSSGSSGSQRMSPSSAYFYSYPISDDGNISYPYVGKIKVKGLNLKEARDTIITRFDDYFQGGMSITVKLANNYINVLGEVKSPGRKQLSTERLNIFEAIALSGDLSPYAKRSELRIIRETENGPKVKTFDIRSDEIIHSEYYWVRPGDIIYVSRIEGQFFKMDSFNDFLALFSSSVSLILLTLSFSNF